MNIAIDGPAGAGKSTIAKQLAERLGLNYLDTGAMYRAVALQVLLDESDPQDPKQVLEAAQKAELSFVDNKICIRGRAVDEEIRTPAVNLMVSKVAKIPQLRAWMVTRQQDIARDADVVMDGRDIGSVVLPNADFKFYLDASIHIRAERRFLQQQGSSNPQSLEDIQDDIRRRDDEDRNRAVGPLMVAKDAVVVDTSTLNVDQVVETLVNLMKE
jgi:cytidylate kinase